MLSFVSWYLAVPPATPICKLEGKPEVKANVTLTCLSSSGKPVPIYKWSKTSPNSEFFFSPMLSKFLIQIVNTSGPDCTVMLIFIKYNALSLPSIHKMERSPRYCMNLCSLSDQVNGTLKLNNLSSNMSGKYECTASNSAGEAKCYINLEVITCKSYCLSVCMLDFILSCMFYFLIKPNRCVKKAPDTHRR